MKDASPHVNYFSRAASQSKHELTDAGRGRTMLSAIFHAHDLRGDYISTVVKLHHVFIAMRSFVTEAPTLGHERATTIETYLKFEDPEYNKLLGLFNPYVPADNELFRLSFPALSRKVKTHDIFKRGPAMWTKGAASSAVVEYDPECLGVAGNVSFDTFMQVLFDQIWSPNSISDRAAVRSVLVVTASRAIGGIQTWTNVLSKISKFFFFS